VRGGDEGFGRPRGALRPRCRTLHPPAMRVSVGVLPRLRVLGGKVAVEPSARSFVRCGVLLVAGSVREELEGNLHLFHPVRDSEGRANGATVEGGRSFLRTVARR